ncbi:HTTM domain-containing protein [Streptomyces sp. WAC 00631]|uniref:HTTM domain-containing protein n=1 Tax=Streptomyces sp. WAC 00631 TaxID=2203201 RepID=UPI000F7B8A1E|nr:HTTM domain-containing protein [Streptomyces sp. WAC 00631]MCC5032430.1 HTTM domain-containing protein [Streptomyces sp. WAC 00631]
MSVSRFAGALARGITRVTGGALGPYQSAVVRIGFSFTWLVFLLREWPHRRELYGPDGPWSWDMARQLTDGNGAFTVLMWSDGRLWFETVYLLSVAASALLLLGWRTRTVSVLFMVGVLSLQNRSVFMGDGGDNVIHLMAIYLVLTRCGSVWSLDARRERRRRRERESGFAGGEAAEVHEAGEAGETTPAARTAAPRAPRDVTGVVLWSLLGLVLALASLLPGLATGWAVVFWGLWLVHALWWAVNRYVPGGELRAVLDMTANLVHNAALFVIMAEVCLIYATAGWYKVQGSRWQDGTALHYPLHLDYFTPWPALSEALGSNGVMVMLITYGTVIVQVAFPFTLFNRRVKNVLLAAMMTEHFAISVVLGLPFFSLAMIAADAVFLPTGFLRSTGRIAGRIAGRITGPARGRLLPGQRRRGGGTDGSSGKPAAGDPEDRRRRTLVG